MNNLDPYKILNIHKNYTLSELKNNYKIVAKKVHPDRGGNQELFNLVSLAYKKLHEEYKLKQINKQFNDLKSDFTTFKDNQNNTQKRNTKINKTSYQNNSDNFSDVFNKVYEDNKIKNQFDNGYGDMMLENTGDRSDINIDKKIHSMKNFNSAFDSEPISKYNKKLIRYKEPEALPSSCKTLKYTELGGGKIKDFSTETNNLQCVDYRRAHSTSKLIDHSAVRARTEYKDINSIESERSNVSYKMSDEDLKKMAYLKKKEELKERKRIERQKKLDLLAEKNFENINKLMVGFKK